ncbi:MAG TPA: L-threonylcarbamoyladenylate synthase [Candidatus Latescibacteria bacterium]|nr:L-threonylcarbamoyladenylate synthase [Candidatus Latescibacterota bacterium]
MKTRFIGIDPVGENAAQVGEIAAALLEDAVAAYPTETFYALGAAAFSRKAVKRVYGLKNRDAGKPLSVIASDLDMVREISASPHPSFRLLAEEFWPGPLTLVLPAAAGLPEFLLGPGRTIAVRIPPLSWLRVLVKEIGQPLTATSANLSGEKELADPAEVIALFRDKVEVVVDGGPSPGGVPSTIVDLTSPEPRVLRIGTIPEIRILAVLRS